MTIPRTAMIFVALLLTGAIVPMAQTPPPPPAAPDPPAPPAGKPARPCASEEVYRQLDFWVGEWEVSGPKGQKAGTNSIVKTLDGCLILENWTGSEGSSGKSMNYFDPVTKKWTQTWVDNGGGVIAYEGELKNGAMLLQGSHREKAGTTVRSRMSLTPQPNGHVRQVIEESRDGGKTWSVWFAGDYAPRK